MTSSTVLINEVTSALQLREALRNAGLTDAQQQTVIRSPQLAKIMVANLILSEKLLVGLQTPTSSVGPLTPLRDPVVKFTNWAGLKPHRVETLADASLCTEGDILAIRNYGPKRANELEAALAEAGLTLRDAEDDFWAKATLVFGSFGLIPSKHLLFEVEDYRNVSHYAFNDDWYNLFQDAPLIKDLAEEGFAALYAKRKLGDKEVEIFSDEEIQNLIAFVRKHHDMPF